MGVFHKTWMYQICQTISSVQILHPRLLFCHSNQEHHIFSSPPNQIPRMPVLGPEQSPRSARSILSTACAASARCATNKLQTGRMHITRITTHNREPAHVTFHNHPTHESIYTTAPTPPPSTAAALCQAAASENACLQGCGRGDIHRFCDLRPAQSPFTPSSVHCRPTP